MDLVLGVDAGGTASRAVLATLDGDIVGRGAAGPGNPLSCGSAAATAVGSALHTALTGHDPSRVAGGVLGVAGTSAKSPPEIVGAFAEMWAGLGLSCPMRLVGDVVTAFAAGTPSPSGRTLIACAISRLVISWTFFVRSVSRDSTCFFLPRSPIIEL